MKLLDIVIGLFTLAIAGAAGALIYSNANQLDAEYAQESQPIPEATAAEFKKAETLLGELAWVDKSAGVVKMPIEDSMKLVQKQLADGSFKPFVMTEEMKQKALEKLLGGVTNEGIEKLYGDAAAMDSGKQVWDSLCVACHKADGSGSIGPNMTDPYWIHGSKPTEMYLTVMNGVGDKGMPAWGPSIGKDKAMAVVAFIKKNIADKNLPGKAPQGVNAEGQAAP